MVLETARSAVRTAGRGLVRAGAVATASSRVEPDLVVIGVKRGGTTSLFRDLERHPSMHPLVPSARRLPLRENQKGVHYFDSNVERGDRWYRSHFPTTRTMQRLRGRTGAAFTAEASPYYFFHPLGARRACLTLRSAHFVVLLRDPVERTVSHWAEQTRNGVETLALAAALEAEHERVGEDGDLLRTGALASSHAHEQQTYVAQSEYHASLRRWFDLAGRDRVLVVFSEDYYAAPDVVLDRITEALDVPPVAAAATRRNAAPRPSSLDPGVEARLVERFAPDVDAVTELLGERPPWPRFGGRDARGER